MNTKIILLAILTIASSQAFSHSGGTDSQGGHNCSDSSIRKGLCYGYHYHNGGYHKIDAPDHTHHDLTAVKPEVKKVSNKERPQT